MPRYVTEANVVTSYGEQRFALLADHDNDQNADDGMALQAILAAEAEVDSYLGHRFALPLPGCEDGEDPANNTVPANIRRRTEDIAVYLMAKDHDQLTKERRRRYEDAVKWLTMVSKGEIGLGLAVPPPTRNGGVVRLGPERTHQLGSTKGLV